MANAYVYLQVKA